MGSEGEKNGAQYPDVPSFGKDWQLTFVDIVFWRFEDGVVQQIN